MERLLPDLAMLTDEQFEAFFKKTTTNNYGRKALAKLVPSKPEVVSEPESDMDAAKGSTAATASAQAVAHTELTPAPKFAQVAINSNSKPAEAARVAG